MDLTCAETVNEKIDINCAETDQTMITDPRIIPNLVSLERVTTPNFDYFLLNQPDIEPYMRKVVAVWMMEVCEEQHCESQVFPLSMNCMDRFLSLCSITRFQFQLLGATCLLLASKIRQCHALTTDILCAYTDCSVTPTQMRDFELIILSKLQWNINAVTGFDFIDHIIERVPWGWKNVQIRQHAHTLVSICMTENIFIQTLPSVLASACVCSAVRGLKLSSSQTALHDVCRLTLADPIDVEHTIISIELLIAKEMKNSIKQFTTTIIKTQQQQQQQYLYLQQQQQQQQYSSLNGGKLISNDEYETPETPTDIQDVYF